MRRSDIGWALMLSLPLAGGVVAGLLKVTAGRVTPMVVGGGLLTFLGVALLVILGAADWSDAADGGSADN